MTREYSKIDINVKDFCDKKVNEYGNIIVDGVDPDAERKIIDDEEEGIE